MNKLKKNNIVKFPEIKVTEQEKEIEAILFASNIPLDVEAIESKITKKINVEKRWRIATFIPIGINLVCISNKWSFRTSESCQIFYLKKKL